jgi:hypothetical protein
MFELSKTNRGFAHGSFTDLYGVKCSIQKSSLATKDAIWFGVDDANPQIMCSDAKRLGLPTVDDRGWQNYNLPEEVLITTRMHLTQEQVKEMLPILAYFAKHGELPNQ